MSRTKPVRIRETVYVVGAGFSAGLGYPLTKSGTAQERAGKLPGSKCPCPRGRKALVIADEPAATTAVWVRIADRLGAVRMKLFHTVGEQRDGCMISAVFEPKKRFRFSLSPKQDNQELVSIVIGSTTQRLNVLFQTVRGVTTMDKQQLAGLVCLAFMCSTAIASAAQANPQGNPSQDAVESSQQEPAPAASADIVRDPTEVPPSVGNRPPRVIKVSLTTKEVEGWLDAPVGNFKGTSFKYWTFNGKVPGPMLRVLQGDTVEVTLTNPPDSQVNHSIDLHAVVGPGGGQSATEAKPAETKAFSFKALKPGLYIYHCGTSLVAQHIANGMYGLILVEPPGGLPKVDHEFYLMQGEIYTAEGLGDPGHQKFSLEKLMAERPEYMVFNGAVGAITNEHVLKAKVGESIRIFFGDGGPNMTSSLHVIGEILDKVYNEASLTSPPLTDVQTTVVPPGGATVVELKALFPGRYVIVDHALIRVARGLVGYLDVSGSADPSIFHAGVAP